MSIRAQWQHGEAADPVGRRANGYIRHDHRSTRCNHVLPFQIRSAGRCGCDLSAARTPQNRHCNHASRSRDLPCNQDNCIHATALHHPSDIPILFLPCPFHEAGSMLGATAHSNRRVHLAPSHGYLQSSAANLEDSHDTSERNRTAHAAGSLVPAVQFLLPADLSNHESVPMKPEALQLAPQ